MRWNHGGKIGATLGASTDVAPWLARAWKDICGGCRHGRSQSGAPTGLLGLGVVSGTRGKQDERSFQRIKEAKKAAVR